VNAVMYQSFYLYVTRNQDRELTNILGNKFAE